MNNEQTFRDLTEVLRRNGERCENTEAYNSLSELASVCRARWNERQEDCAKLGANIPMPTIKLRVDDLANLISVFQKIGK